MKNNLAEPTAERQLIKLLMESYLSEESSDLPEKEVDSAVPQEEDELPFTKENPFREEIKVLEGKLNDLSFHSLSRKKHESNLKALRKKADQWEREQPHYKGTDPQDMTPSEYKEYRLQQKLEKIRSVS